MPPPQPKGFEARDLASGTVYLRLPHYADPAKGAQWLATLKQEMIDVPEQFRREILMDESVSSGQPIYANYDDALHVYRNPEGVEAFIPVMPSCLYFGGWDCGQTLQPAFLLYQVLPRPFQVHALLEVISEGGEPMELFAPRVALEIRRVLPGAWDQVRHYADSSVTARDGTRGGTAQQEARRHGFDLSPVSNVWDPRLGAMTWLFNRRLDDGKPGLRIDALRCPTFRAACQGKYKYQVSSLGDQSGPGAVIIQPLKNAWSHVADAGQYAAIKIRKMVEGDTGAVLGHYA